MERILEFLATSLWQGIAAALALLLGILGLFKRRWRGLSLFLFGLGVGLFLVISVAIFIPRKGHLEVIVCNAEQKPLPSLGGMISIHLFDASWNFLTEKTLPFSGGESYVKEVFTDLDYGEYEIEVYYAPTGGLKHGYWGSREVNVPGTYLFERSSPLCEGIHVSKPQVSVGEKIHLDVKVKNPKAAKEVEARLIVDRDKSTPYDFDEAVILTVPAQSCTDFGFDFIPPFAGRFYSYVFVRTKYFDKWTLTGQCVWTETFIVAKE